jgi:signal transduction histidine kinase
LKSDNPSKHRSTVFSRLLATYIGIMLLTQAGQCLLMANLYQRQYYSQKVFSVAQDAADLAQAATTALTATGSLNGQFVSSVYSVAQRQQAAVWLVNTAGDIYNIDELTYDINKPNSTDDNTTQQPPTYLNMKIPDGVFNQRLKTVMHGGTVSEKGLFSGVAGPQILTIGIPIMYNKTVMGAIFIHTRLETLQYVLAQTYGAILPASAFSVFLGMILIFLMASRFSKPLVQMNAIAGHIAKGEFDRKADVKSNDEIGQLAQSFNTMAEELKKQEDLRSGFVANVSHELRSPLTSIHGFAQGMLDGTIPQGEHQKYLDVIVGETRRLNKLIRELLDLSQIESGKFPLNMQSFDINELIRRVLITFEEKINNKSLEIEVDFRQDRAMVTADPDRIEQVLINLLDNAIKFTEDSGRIKIWTHSASDKMLVGVGDNGPGIPEEDQPYVWERFYKVDKSHSGKKGTGLGLSIVKKIIDQHGERITMQSQPGNGTVFVFSVKKTDI